MNLKFLLKAASVALLSSVVLAENDCDEIKDYLSSKGQSYEKNIDKCEVDSNGKVTTLFINSDTLKLEDVDKLTSYDTIEKLQYYFGLIPDYDEGDYHISKLVYFPNSFSKMTNLKELILLFEGEAEYERAPIKEGVLKVNKNLEKLILEGTEITNENIKEISELTNLKKLSILKNFGKVNFDPLESLTNLEILEITRFHHSPLKAIPKFIYSLSNLKSLLIIRQEISEIPSELSKLRNLEYLDLRGNHFGGEIPEALNDLPKLTEINLSDNPNLKGKTLTNESLEKCTYDPESRLCIAKDMACFPKDFPFKTCKGQCGDGIGKCPKGQCCSKHGWCGASEKHCSISNGCQSDYGDCLDSSNLTTTITTIITTTTTSSTETNIPISTNGRCGEKDGICPKNQCCSKFGWCGTGEKHCSVINGCQSAFGKCDSTNGRCGKEYGKCPKGQCCSKYGYCGTSDKYCDKGCQSEYGKCK